MKNKFIEYKKHSAKQYAKKWNAPRNAQGNHFPHLFENSSKLASCEEVFFKLGSQVVVVWWVHPRQQYLLLCDECAYLMMLPLRNDTPLIFKPKYKKIDNSRKKAMSFELVQSSTVEEQEFWQKYREKYHELLTTSDFVIKPFINIKQYDWCLGVDICLPLEVLDETSANELVAIVKDLLRQETTLDKLYPNYQYTKENWQQETPFRQPEN